MQIALGMVKTLLQRHRMPYKSKVIIFFSKSIQKWGIISYTKSAIVT